jgi:hypothetical protein
MPTPPFDPNVQNNFPIASVIQAAQENAQRQLQARTQGNQDIIQGLGAIGQVGQSLLDRRRAMAQALAGAQLYSNTPEGKEMLGTNQVTSGPTGQPVTMNDTAQGGVGQAPQPNKPSIDLQTLATAFYGDKPSDVMKQMFEQHKLKVESGLKAQQIASQQQLGQALLGIRGQEVGVRGQQVTGEQSSNIRNQITALEGKKSGIIKDFPELSGSILSGILPAGLNQKQTAAFNDYRDTQNQIDNYNRQLGGPVSSGGQAQHMSTADLLAIYNQQSQ